MTADERKAAFLADFKALLRKHDAEMMTLAWNEPAEIFMVARFEDGVVVDDSVWFDLPRFENGKG